MATRGLVHRARAWLRAAAPFVATLVAPAGCGSSAPVQLCGEIPEGGCPIGRGGSCEDVTCAALYDCLEGAWEQVERCPDGGEGGGGTGGSGEGGAGGGGGCEVPDIDRTGEAEGCAPDLLDPDCPVAAALVCPDPCSTGCADFFLCTAEGWVDVAACGPDGALIVLPR